MHLDNSTTAHMPGYYVTNHILAYIMDMSLSLLQVVLLWHTHLHGNQGLYRAVCLPACRALR